ncbi:MAG: hypothetical protein GVY15_13135 [Bacteroidetes bacterium]|jgi:plastocyanin domain-containing protein|nr:hypothetical protein [Bacteroidota bacterium]
MRSTLLFSLLAAFLLTACGVDAPDASADEQVIEIDVTNRGYAPAQIELTAGVPTRLVVTRTGDSACASQLQIPDMDIAPTDLPLDKSVEFAFTPTEEGTYAFTCGMDMLTGTLSVQS